MKVPPQLLRVYEATRDWGGRHPGAVDLGWALLILSLAWVQPRMLPPDRFAFWPLLLQVALVLPLTLRRRAPFAVFMTTAGVAFLQWVTTGVMPADVAVLFALCTVAIHSPGRQAAAAFAVSELGALLAAWRLVPDPDQMPPRTAREVFALFLLFSGTVVAALATGLTVRSRRAQVAGLRERASALEQQRDQQAALAVARERSRIAREMHDIVTHNLSVMVALADGAVYASQKSPERATAAMRQSAETGRAALADMRRFLGVLRADEPDALRHPQPGLGQLEALVQQVRAAGLPTELRLTGDQDAASAGAQLTAYRLVQESLTNTLKHTAPGARAFVSVHVTDRTLELDVRDDGRALPRPPGHVGQGLGGMRERAAAYGGRLSAGPQPLGGWRVAAVLDLEDPDAREKESA